MNSRTSLLSSVSTPPFTRRSCAAYTLIELLAALMLAAILACAALAMTRNLLRQVNAPSSAEPIWIGRLRKTLAEELTEGATVRRIPEGFEVEGPLHPKPAITDDTHRPIKVIWRVEKGQLLREETDLLTGGYRRQLVVIGIDRLDFTQPADQGSAGNHQLTLTGSAMPKGLSLSIPRGGGNP